MALSLNEQIDAFQQKVREHQQKIINDERQINSVEELQVFFKDVINLNKIYYNICKQLTKKQKAVLENELEKEISFIKTSNTLISRLLEYHKTKLFDEKEWKDFCTIIRYQNLEYSLQEKKTADWSQYESIAFEVLGAEARMMKRLDLSVSNFDINRGKVKGEEKKYELNLDTFLKSDLFGQIEYLEKLLGNIEKRKGPKAKIIVGGLTKEVSWEYAYNYQFYTALLDNLYLGREEEFRKVKNKHQINEEPSPDIRVEDAEEYVDFSKEMDKIEDRFLILTTEASKAPKEETIDVGKSETGEIFRILRKDIPEFEMLVEKYKMLLQNGKTLTEKLIQYGIEPFKGSDKDIEARKIDILKKIDFLQQNRNGNPAVDACIQEKVIEYCKLSKQEKFRFMASFIHFFKKQGFSDEDAKSLAKLAYNPEVFAKNKNIPNEKKKKVLSKLFTTIAPKETIIEEEQKEGIQENENFQIDWKAVSEMSFKEEYEYFGALAAKISKYSEKYPNNQIYAEFEGNMYPVNEKDKAIFEKCHEEAKRVWNEWRGGLAKKEPTINTSDEMVKKALKKIQKQKESMPKSDKKYISKIKKKRNPRNKRDLKEKMRKRIPQIAAVLGAGVLLFFGANGLENILTQTNIEPQTKLEGQGAFENALAEKVGLQVVDLIDIVDKENNEKIDLVQEAIDNGYSVDENAKIYENYYEAYNDVNAKTAYFSNDSYRDVTEVVYNSNGTLVHLNVDDPDFESQRIALENNGYQLDSFRGRNENGQGNGYEGYFKIEDVDVFNAQIGGR